MQCSASAKPLTASWHIAVGAVKLKLVFVNVTKLFQNVNKSFWHAKAVEFNPLQAIHT